MGCHGNHHAATIPQRMIAIPQLSDPGTLVENDRVPSPLFYQEVGGRWEDTTVELKNKFFFRQNSFFKTNDRGIPSWRSTIEIVSGGKNR